jgi:hypothetical protein
VIWHIVRFDFGDMAEDARERLEASLAGLTAIDEVAFLRLGRDLDDPAVTGLVTGFATPADLETYRVHPEHVPVVQALREAGVGVVRLDLSTDDDVSELPA